MTCSPTSRSPTTTRCPKRIRNYQNIGRGDRDRNYFLRMYLGDVRAVDYLAGRPDWNGETLVAMGTSMGGQQSICTAAFSGKVHRIDRACAGWRRHAGAIAWPRIGVSQLASQRQGCAADCAVFRLGELRFTGEGACTGIHGLRGHRNATGRDLGDVQPAARPERGRAPGGRGPQSSVDGRAAGRLHASRRCVAGAAAQRAVTPAAGHARGTAHRRKLAEGT